MTGSHYSLHTLVILYFVDPTIRKSVEQQLIYIQFAIQLIKVSDTFSLSQKKKKKR